MNVQKTTNSPENSKSEEYLGKIDTQSWSLAAFLYFLSLTLCKMDISLKRDI